MGRPLNIIMKFIVILSFFALPKHLLSDVMLKQKLMQRLMQMALELGMVLLLEQCLPLYASQSHKKSARTELLKLQEKFATQNMMR